MYSRCTHDALSRRREQPATAEDSGRRSSGMRRARRTARVAAKRGEDQVRSCGGSSDRPSGGRRGARSLCACGPRAASGGAAPPPRRGSARGRARAMLGDRAAGKPAGLARRNTTRRGAGYAGWTRSATVSPHSEAAWRAWGNRRAIARPPGCDEGWVGERRRRQRRRCAEEETGGERYRRGCGDSATITGIVSLDSPCVRRCCVPWDGCATDGADRAPDQGHGSGRLAASLGSSFRATPPVRKRYNVGGCSGRCGRVSSGMARRPQPERDAVRRAHQTAGPRVSPARRGARALVGRKPDLASFGEESVTDSRYNAPSLRADVLRMYSRCAHHALTRCVRRTHPSGEWHCPYRCTCSSASRMSFSECRPAPRTRRRLRSSAVSTR